MMIPEPVQMQTLQKCIMQYKYNNCKACNYWEVKGSSYFLSSGSPTGTVRQMKEQHFFTSIQKELVPFIR